MKIRKFLKNRLTIIFVPHTVNPSKRITLSFSFTLFLVVLWTGLTIWAGYISGRHFDYWRVKLDKEMIKLKLLFFADQIKKSNELIEEVKQKDIELRNLLNLKDKKSIILSEAKGGPSEEDRKYLKKFLSKKIEELSIIDYKYQCDIIRNKAEQVLNSCNEINEFISQQKLLYSSTPNMWPSSGRITSPFGFRIHPITGNYEFHTGIDISNNIKTPVYSTAKGRVKMTGYISGYGKLVIIDHGMGYETVYAHLFKILVSEGQSVKRGELIGLMGETGTTTGVHLHYEVLYNNKLLNPIKYLDKDNFFKSTAKIG